MRVALLAVALVVATAAEAGAPAAPGPREALRGRTVVLDPGHNPGNFRHPEEINRLVDAGTLRKACDTTGTATRSGYTEAAFTYDVAVRTRRILRAAGARVVLTRGARRPAWGPCITERAAIANRLRAHVAVSIHADGGPSSGRGFHVIYPAPVRGLTDDIAAASYVLALKLRSTYRVGTGVPYATYTGSSGLDARSDLGGLNLSDVPKVFVETGNMRNSTDAALLESGRFRQRIAQAIANGIGGFLAAR
ncbi:MAG: N-acetylmuramoyl-L-alanine amidase [Gaiellaceae bacterium]